MSKIQNLIFNTFDFVQWFDQAQRMYLKDTKLWERNFKEGLERKQYLWEESDENDMTIEN